MSTEERDKIEEQLSDKIKYVTDPILWKFNRIFFSFVIVGLFLLILIGVIYLIIPDHVIYSFPYIDYATSGSSLRNFLIIIFLFGMLGGTYRQVNNLFKYYWRINRGKGNSFYEKNEASVSRQILNSNPKNMLWVRPIFMPVIGGVGAIITTLLFYGLNIGLIKAIVFSFLIGVVGREFVLMLPQYAIDQLPLSG